MEEMSMKKVIIGLIATFTLFACLPEDFSFTKDEKVKLFTFPSVFGSDTLAISIMNPFSFSNFTEYSQYPSNSDKLYAVATYETDCPACQEQAAYFDKLAKEFKYSGIQFAILFIENDKQAIQQLDYLKELSVPVYYNAESFCKEGLNRIVTPGVVFIANEKANYKNYIGWDTKSTAQGESNRSYHNLRGLLKDFCYKNPETCEAPPEE